MSSDTTSDFSPGYLPLSGKDVGRLAIQGIHSGTQHNRGWALTRDKLRKAVLSYFIVVPGDTLGIRSHSRHTIRSFRKESAMVPGWRTKDKL